MKSSGRRRVESGHVRRSVDLKGSSTRRFSRRKDSILQDAFMPPPAHAGVPMKKRVLASRLRAVALCAFCLVLIAVFKTHHRREIQDRKRAASRLSRLEHEIEEEERNSSAVPRPSMAESAGRDSDSVSEESTSADETKSGESSENHGSAEEKAGASQELARSEEARNLDAVELKEQIESIFRTDMMAGAHPMCRISNACILANGLISLPHWMSKDDSLLRQCGVGPHVFHPDNDGPRSSVVRRVDADLAQLLRLARFKEPSSVLSEFFADSILHSAFLFDSFHRTSDAAVIKRHCVSTASGAECASHGEDGSSISSAHAAIRPAIFIPRKILNNENSWEAQAASLLDQKYGAEDLVRVEVDKVLDPAEKEKTSNVSATCFRSILISDSKLRDLPDDAFPPTTSTFFAKNDIDRSPREIRRDESCSINVGLLQKSGNRAVQNIEELKEKIETIATAALPSAHVAVSILIHGKEVPFRDQIANVKDVDILVGGSSNSLSHMAFMRTGGSVFEIFPFAWQPPNFADMARILSLKYRQVLSQPQTVEFKTCLEHEVFQLRKQHRIGAEEVPEWVKQAERKWEEAAGDFVLTEKSSLLLNTDTSGISNYHTRACARRQSVSFNTDELAKAIVLDARSICHPKQSGTQSEGSAVA